MSYEDTGYISYNPNKKKRCSECLHTTPSEIKKDKRLQCKIIKVLVEPYASCKSFLSKNLN